MRQGRDPPEQRRAKKNSRGNFPHDLGLAQLDEELAHELGESHEKQKSQEQGRQSGVRHSSGSGVRCSTGKVVCFPGGGDVCGLV